MSQRVCYYGCTVSSNLAFTYSTEYGVCPAGTAHRKEDRRCLHFVYGE